MPEQYTNGAQTTLANAIGAGDTTLAVKASTSVGFPTSGNFRVLIDSELLLVTAVAGMDDTTWTVTRAIERWAGVQTGANHTAGATVTYVLTVASLDLAAGGITVGSSPIASGNNGSVLFQAGNVVNQDFMGNFAYDPDGTLASNWSGFNSHGNVLYVGDFQNANYDGTLALYDIADGKWMALNVHVGFWNFAAPGSVPGSSDGGIHCGVLTLSSAGMALIFDTQTSGAGAHTGTLNNAPAAGDPGFWLPVTINGTTYYIPCWS